MVMHKTLETQLFVCMTACYHLCVSKSGASLIWVPWNSRILDLPSHPRVRDILVEHNSIQYLAAMKHEKGVEHDSVIGSVMNIIDQRKKTHFKVWRESKLQCDVSIQTSILIQSSIFFNTKSEHENLPTVGSTRLGETPNEEPKRREWNLAIWKFTTLNLLHFGKALHVDLLKSWIPQVLLETTRQTFVRR